MFYLIKPSINEETILNIVRFVTDLREFICSLARYHAVKESSIKVANETTAEEQKSANQASKTQAQTDQPQTGTPPQDECKGRVVDPLSQVDGGVLSLDLPIAVFLFLK